MEKRPVLWLGMAYVTGEIFEYLTKDKAVSLWIGGTLLFLTLLGNRVPRIRQFMCSKWLLLLPLLFMAGSFNLGVALERAQQFDQVLAEEIGVISLQGELRSLSEREKVFFAEVRMNYQGEQWKFLAILDKAAVESLCVGDTLQITGTLQAFEQPTNEGQYDEWSYYHAGGYVGKIFADSVRCIKPSEDYLGQMRETVRGYIRNNCDQLLNQLGAGCAKAMLLGERTSLDPDWYQLLLKSGIAHILAISGLHISFLGMGIFWILKHVWIPERVSICLAILLVGAYVWLIGDAPSVVRAWMAFVLLMLARLIGRKRDGPTALSLAALVILIFKPMQLFQPGFLLSFLAVFILFYIQSLKTKYRKPLKKGQMSWICYYFKGFLSTMGMTLGMYVAMMPLTARFFFEVPIYSFLLNLVIIPMMSLLYPLLFLGGLFGTTLGVAGNALSALIEVLINIFTWLCEMVQKLWNPVIITGKPSVVELCVIYALLIGSIWLYYRFHKKCCCAGILCVLILFLPRHPDKLQVIMMDVGQGECILIRSPDGVNILIDGGSLSLSEVKKYRIEPCLKALGIRYIDTVFLSHLDADHSNGIISLLDDSMVGHVEVGPVILPKLKTMDTAYQDFVRTYTLQDHSLYTMGAGDQLTFGRVELYGLSPDSENMVEARNESCMVLLLKYENFQMLLTGDMSLTNEAVLYQNKMFGQCDILKVAHHGSKNSTSADFLSNIDPTYSIISCGLNNSYGHPHSELLERLAASGTQIYITARDGAVTIWTDGKRFGVTAYREIGSY